jgi:lipopolysaccharide/colanic/teichoic acid biosynthesis glycosyltransferase
VPALIKRAIDAVGAAVGLLVLSPVLVIAALLVKLDSAGPVFFRQTRVGRHFQPFRIYKFRTMVCEQGETARPITYGSDARITRIGRVLRMLKIDELPQLINVVKGEMSLVGPRPELPRYVEMFRADYEQLLEVRPGITDPASLCYRNEAEMLGHVADPEHEYVTRVLPHKIRLAKAYVRGSGLAYDLKLIFLTLVLVVIRRRRSSWLPSI